MPKTKAKQTRQRKWQKKKLAQGRCHICGKPAVFKKEWRKHLVVCEFHKRYRNKYNKKYRVKLKTQKEGKDE